MPPRGIPNAAFAAANAVRAYREETGDRNIYTLKLKLSRATVCRALDDLYQAGFLTREQCWRENGGRTSNLYEII